MKSHVKAFSLCIDKKQKTIFLKNPITKNKKTKNLNKMSFSSSANSQYFLMKISWIGPWVSRID
jgi:hypothetical protein